jgi:hypothetical protein
MTQPATDDSAAAASAAREAKAEMYDGLAWTAYAGMFLAIPFAVMAFRLHMQAWHYYLAGGLFLGCAALFFAVDFAATALRDANTQVPKANRTLAIASANR